MEVLIVNSKKVQENLVNMPRIKVATVLVIVMYLTKTAKAYREI